MQTKLSEGSFYTHNDGWLRPPVFIEKLGDVLNAV